MKIVNTLKYDKDKCTGCGMCTVVCPHRVFSMNARKAKLLRYEACMECGACERNCPADAITVDSGVGCATAMIVAALKGKKEPTCGCDTSEQGPSCCG